MNHDLASRVYPILHCFALVLGLIFVSGCFLNSLGQSSANPVPFINQPLLPATAAPGGASFTLTVNGTGFISGAVASWNGSPRTTTFVSSSQLTVSVPASDIVNAGTANVAVKNPGGIASQPVLFDIASPISAVGFAFVPNSLGNCANVVADFNGDGKMDLVACNADVITVLLGNGDGTFNALPPVGNPAMVNPTIFATADVNNDGKTDLVGFGGLPGTVTQLTVLLGNGDGTFQQPVTFAPGWLDVSGFGSIAVGDFNGDGRQDFAVTLPSAVLCHGPCPGFIWIYLGNGDGTFQAPITYNINAPFPVLPHPTGLAIGDFNRDGKLDLIVSDPGTNAVYVLLGNGDGTFQAPQSVTLTASGQVGYFAIADLDGDTKLDLVVNAQDSVNVSLGNGDGTFRTGMSFPAASTGAGLPSLALGDFNGDGELDVVRSDSLALLLLGNGDGTFRTYTNSSFPGIGFSIWQFGVGDFNQDGRLDLVVPQGVLLQTTAQVSPFAVSFGNQNDDTTSASQNVLLTNLSSSALTINTIDVTGTNSGDFAIQSNSCGTTVPPGANCTIGVTFTPVAKGNRTASLAFTDGATASPQVVALSGTGVGTAPPAVGLSPASLSFSAIPLSISSSQIAVTLTNTGDLELDVNGIIFQGANPGDFTQINDCSRVLGGSTCSINVTFTPGATGSRNATMQIIDNAADSPQTMAVSGTGTAPTLGLVVPSGSPSSATVQAGGPAPYTLAIGGGGFSGTASLVCTGAPTGAVCSVPSTIAVASATASIFTANITTTSRTLSAFRLIENPPSAWAWTLFFFGIAIYQRISRMKRGLLRFAWLIPLAASLCGCGSGGTKPNVTNPNGTPAGTYTLTVAATSGSSTQSVNLTLVVE